MMSGWDFHDDFRSRFSAKYLVAREASHHAALMGNFQIMYSHVFSLSMEWIVHCLSVLAGIWGMEVVAVDLVIFGENWFIVKTSGGEVWSEGLLRGTCVVGSYTEKRKPKWTGRLNVYFLFGCSNGCVRAVWL